jgi:hypothetical protein
MRIGELFGVTSTQHFIPGVRTMLNHQSQPSETSQTEDPWQASEQPEKDQRPQPWHLEPEAHPLIAAEAAPEALLTQAGASNALQLPSPTHPSEQDSTTILLQDELKLRAKPGNLWDRIRDALALLWWQAR